MPTSSLLVLTSLGQPKNVSQFWVMDALTMSPTPVAIVELPARVPYGFHGIFVPLEDIKKQADAAAVKA
jgi:carotenoid cleavage dioxygenase-like enzyme